MVGRASKKQVVILICAAAVAALMVMMLAVASNKPAEAATDVPPDLRMAALQNLQIENTADGRKLLRFDTIIVNVGPGKFQLHGTRPDTSSPMTVKQRIYNDAGGYRTIPTDATMYFAGDGHNHWHVRDLETYKLIRLDNGSKVGTGAKHGFCFFDNYPFGSTQDVYYRGCSHDPDALRVRAGLSSGWGDIYKSTLPDQYIDITGLASGSYRLRAAADAQNWFLETHEKNNFTWTDIQISGDSVSVIQQGPAAQPI